MSACWSSDCSKPSSASSSRSQVASLTASINAMYSASGDESATVSRLFEHQLTGPPFSAKKINAELLLAAIRNSSFPRAFEISKDCLDRFGLLAGSWDVRGACATLWRLVCGLTSQGPLKATRRCRRRCGWGMLWRWRGLRILRASCSTKVVPVLKTYWFSRRTKSSICFCNKSCRFSGGRDWEGCRGGGGSRCCWGLGWVLHSRPEEADDAWLYLDLVRSQLMSILPPWLADLGSRSSGACRYIPVRLRRCQPASSFPLSLPPTISWVVNYPPR